MPKKLPVEDELSMLEYGDLIEICWVDASKLINCTDKHLQQNRIYAFYDKNVGRFYSIKLDKVYSTPFLIILLETLGNKHTVLSVPVCLIKKITRISKQSPRRFIRPVGDPYLTGGAIKYQKVSRFEAQKTT